MYVDGRTVLHGDSATTCVSAAFPFGEMPVASVEPLGDRQWVGPAGQSELFGFLNSEGENEQTA